MRYHKRFTNFDRRTIAATKLLRRNWSSSTDTEKWIKMDGWVQAVAGVYGFQIPALAFNRQAGDGFYSPSKNEINMSKPSIVTLIHEFRHAMQSKQVATGFSRLARDVEHDARAWSLSLYFKVAPVSFRRLVAEGKIYHITMNDLTRGRTTPILEL